MHNCEVSVLHHGPHQPAPGCMSPGHLFQQNFYFAMWAENYSTPNAFFTLTLYFVCVCVFFQNYTLIKLCNQYWGLNFLAASPCMLLMLFNLFLKCRVYAELLIFEEQDLWSQVPLNVINIFHPPYYQEMMVFLTAWASFSYSFIHTWKWTFLLYRQPHFILSACKYHKTIIFGKNMVSS